MPCYLHYCFRARSYKQVQMQNTVICFLFKNSSKCLMFTCYFEFKIFVEFKKEIEFKKRFEMFAWAKLSSTRLGLASCLEAEVHLPQAPNSYKRMVV